MRKSIKIRVIFLILLLLNSLLFSNENDPYKDIKYFVLDNGMKVYMLSNPDVVNTKIMINVKLGMDIEDESTAGISHLVEHMMFRDKRVPFNDYLDFIKKEGASQINAVTSRYFTSYFATIDSKKTDFIIDTFYNMLFDKQIDDEDLKIEKNALQTEIGELKWYDRVLYILQIFDGKIFPPNKDNFFENEFFLEKKEKLPIQYYYKKNNKNFTLEDIYKYYDEYYYPANMVLKIVGNFDEDKIKKQLIEKFGKVQKTGIKTIEELNKKARLNNTSYKEYKIIPSNKNRAIIGEKYIIDDYKKDLILKAYTSYLADELQLELRNSLGETYSVNKYERKYLNAGVTGVTFDSLPETFEKNIEFIQNKIYEDTKFIDEKRVNLALEKAGIFYKTVENDNETLFKLINQLEFLHKNFGDFENTPYDIFKSISLEDFQSTIKTIFSDKNNSYLIINKDYLLFPFDVVLFAFVLFFINIYIFINVYKIKKRKQNIRYTKREIIFERRISSKFITISIFIVVALLELWISYFLDRFFVDYSFPENWLILFVYHIVLYFIIYITILWTVFAWYYTRIEVTQNRLNFIGFNFKSIKKEEILEVNIVKSSFVNYIKPNSVIGSTFYYRKLVEIKLKDHSIIKIHIKNPIHLQEDIIKWLNN
ncbi:hypothetical protein CRU92_03910 [Arcobacter sp. FW59]|nr:hypothetical protein CRU92_03910 [Arcobacter sp. FW59]